LSGPSIFEEFERNILKVRASLLVGHFQPGDVFAHLHQDVVQAAGVDIDLFHQVAHLADEAEGVTFEVLYGLGDGGRRLRVARQQPDHQLLGRIVV
jgi:hypothetical protein